MSQRMNYTRLLSKEVQQLSAVEGLLEGSGLPLNLLELVKLRASIINGCAYCIRLHTQRLRQQGESEERIDLVAAWRESPFYTEAERAVFEYTEAVTLISDTQEISDELYDKVKAHFSEQELASLTLAIGVINLWNRLAITFKSDLASIGFLLKQSKAADEEFARSLAKV